MAMRKPSLYIKRVTFTLLFITFHSLPYVICTKCGCLSPPSPAPARAPKPSPPPLIFADVRLARVYPVIQTFKSTITCDPLGVTQNWTGSDICSYNGFYCDNPPDNLTATALAAIDFNGFQLCAPTLDPFIGNLPDLAFFHANTNNFTGSIPANISNLRYLYELDLSNNKFSGQFPTAVLAATGLTFLDLRYNFFTGSVPPQIFMQTLDVLFINNNNFMQRLPQNLGATSALFLTLANNKFTGPIPRSIGEASATLTEILLLNNKLTGCLPYELGFLRNATLIDVGNNRVTGPLPWSLGCLEKVEQLNFAGNLLYGQVPDVVCALGLGLGNLVNLSLSDNYFTNVGPLCWKLIKSGVLDVRRNCIPWLHDQRSTAECWGFFWHHYGYCPYLASYSFIPCHHHLHRSTPRPPPPPPSSTVRPGRHLISYSAVRSRHRVSRSWGYAASP